VRPLRRAGAGGGSGDAPAGWAGAAGELHVLDATMLYGPGSGGVARYLREKRAWLARHGAGRHTLVVPGTADGIGPSGEIEVKTLALTRAAYRWPCHPARWAREMRSRVPDLIEAADPGPVGWTAWYVARRLGVPLVGFCHSDVVRLVDHRLGSAAGTIVRLYARLFYRRCDVVIAPSEHMRRRLAEWGVRDARVGPLGVDLETFSPARRDRAELRKLGVPADRRVMVYAGRFAPEKNIDVLLAAFRRLGDDYHLVLAGGGRPIPAQSNVTLVPYLQSSHALARLLASADGLVHAGDQETFGLILLEAMACGRGVVAAAGGAAPEVVGPDAGVLVRPQDPDALAAGVAAFYAAGVDALGARARRRVEQRYSWDGAMRSLMHVYRDALETAGLPSARYAAP